MTPVLAVLADAAPPTGVIVGGMALVAVVAVGVIAWIVWLFKRKQ